MALAEVKLDGVLSGELTDAELAAEHSSITAAVIGRLWQKEGIQGRYFLGKSVCVPYSLFGGQLGQVPDFEAQMGFQVTHICCWGPDLRGTVTTKENRLTRVEVLEELGSARSP